MLRKIGGSLLVLCFVFPANGDEKQPKPQEKTETELEGVWAVVFHPGTEKEEIHTELLFVFQGRSFQFYDRRPKGNIAWTSTGYDFRILPDSNPKQVEIEKYDPDTRKVIVQRVIFKRKKDGILDWCTANWGDAAPKAFKTDEKQIHIHMKRISNNLRDFQNQRDKAYQDALQELKAKIRQQE